MILFIQTACDWSTLDNKAMILDHVAYSCTNQETSHLLFNFTKHLPYDKVYGSMTGSIICMHESEPSTNKNTASRNKLYIIVPVVKVFGILRANILSSDVKLEISKNIVTHNLTSKNSSVEAKLSINWNFIVGFVVIMENSKEASEKRGRETFQRSSRASHISLKLYTILIKCST